MCFDGRGFEEEEVGSCALKQDGAFAEGRRAFGEQYKEVMLQNLQKVDNELDENI